MRLSPFVSLLAAGLILTGCQTLDSINPFSGDGDSNQGDLPDESRRISILELSDTLSVTAAAAPGSIVLPPVYVNTDWPQPGGNISNVVQHTGATGSLAKAWDRNVGDGSNRKGFVTASPIIANGVIYIFDADNTVRAVSEADGSRLWDFKIEKAIGEATRTQGLSIIDRVRDPVSVLDGSGRDKDSVGGGVAVDNNVVYATSGLGMLVALDAQTGELLWQRSTRTPMHSAPTVSDGRLFAITDDNEIMAFDINDQGTMLWSYQGIVETARMLTAPVPAVVGDTVIAPFSSGEIVALRAQNGGVLWQDALSSTARLTPLATLNDIGFGPVIADGFVIASAQSGVMTAFDLRTGQRIWSQPAGSIGMPWIAGDTVFTATTDGKVAALSKLDGTVQWIQQLETFEKPDKRKDRVVWAGPVLAGERLLVASSNNQLVVVNPYDGSIIETRKTGGNVMVPPVIANQTVYLLTDDAMLIALR